MTEPGEAVDAEEAEPEYIEWLSDFVYGTIATLVAVAGLTFETHPEALTSAGVIVVGAVAIWLAHALSRLVSEQAWRRLQVSRGHAFTMLRGSWAILAAAVPALLAFLLAGVGRFPVHVAFTLTDVFGVASLAVVGIVTVGREDRPLGRRITYVVALVAVGALIVLLESLVHLI